jgi:cytochrome P450
MQSSEVYSTPEQFDPYRYLNLRSKEGQENRWQFVTTSEDHLGFGHGMHACPGRFFASNEVKIALVFLLLRFDWKVDENTEGTFPFYFHGAEMMMDSSFKMFYKRRTLEIDILLYH